MVRLPVLLVAALVLVPFAGPKPGVLFSRPYEPSVHSGALLPHSGLPKLPGLRPKRNVRAQMIQVDRRLRDLVVQQETWYAQHRTYGQDADRVGQVAPGDSAAARAVRVQILYAGKQGWAAMASHPKAPGKSCVAYVGVRERLPLIPRSRANGKSATMEGIPACDEG